VGLQKKEEKTDDRKPKKKASDQISYKFFEKFKFKTVRIQKIEEITSSKLTKTIKILGITEGDAKKEFIYKISNILIINLFSVYYDSFIKLYKMRRSI